MDDDGSSDEEADTGTDESDREDMKRPGKMGRSQPRIKATVRKATTEEDIE